MKVETTMRRLERFMEGWISNPSAQLEFARILEEVHNMPRKDHADEPLLEWITDVKKSMKRLGIS